MSKKIDTVLLLIALIFLACFGMGVASICSVPPKEVALIQPYASIGLLYVSGTGFVMELSLALSKSLRTKYLDFNKKESDGTENRDIELCFQKWMRIITIIVMILFIIGLFVIDSPLFVLFSVFYLCILWTRELILVLVLAFHKRKETNNQNDTPKMA